MSLQVIPLNSSPNQTFTVQLNVDGGPLYLNVTIRFNEMAAYWVMSISDIANNLLIDSIPMLVGSYPASNLLEQQKYLNIGSWYVVNISNLIAAQPSVLGIDQSSLIASGYGGGGYGGGGYGGGVGGDDTGGFGYGMSGIDWPGKNNLGSDFQLWVNDTPVV